MTILNLATSTWEEVAGYVDDSVVAVLPLGAVEQHGQHLPFNNDIFCSEGLVRKACEQLGTEKIILLPSIPFGVSQNHMGFPGTISLRPETFMRVVSDVCQSAIHHGIRKIAIVNGHGGNSASIDLVIQDLQAAGRTIIAINWWEVGSDLIKENFGFIFHACEAETSVALALGQRVVSSRIAGTKPLSQIGLFEYNLVGGKPRVRIPTGPVERLSKSGAIGEPQKMDLTKGTLVANQVADRIATVLRDMARVK